MTARQSRIARILGGLALFLAAGFLIFLVWAHRPALAPAAEVPGFAPAQVARGAALARIGDCQSCHMVVPLADFAGGRPLKTPFGMLHGANITPDPETGIGRWTLPAFERALREGVARDGHHLYPAFPYDHFSRLRDEDIAVLYAFLMTRPPVHAVPPRPNLIPPLGFRPFLAGWKLLFLRPRPVEVDPRHDESWNRGRYWVEALAHCQSCHTPRNLLGAEESGKAFRGGTAEGWKAPALANRRGAEVWSSEAIEAYLRTGKAPDGARARGPMAEVVTQLSQAPEPEVRAIAVYIADIMGNGPPSHEGRG